MRRVASVAGLLMMLSATLPAAEAEREDFVRKVCQAAASDARTAGIDGNFFVRLLWRESLFDPLAVSPKGAKGIAQFMPAMAEKRGLADPFEPFAAVAASAHYLAELKASFGNHGLAAAAYNAGEERVTKWLAGKGSMPVESRDYVAFVTGRAVGDWKQATAAHAIPALAATGSLFDNCLKLALAPASVPARTLKPLAPAQPWGALVASHFREGTALAMFRRLRVRFPEELAGRAPMVVRKRNLSRGSRSMALVMLGAPSRAEAEKLCRTLAAAGAPCLVRRAR